MSLEITAKLIDFLPLQSGEGKNGTPWQRQDFIVETQGEYPKKICMSAWGDMVKKASEFTTGAMLKISFRLESREYNGRWYTDVRPWRIESASAPSSNGYATTQQPAMVSVGDPVADLQSKDDDLPF